MSLWTTLPSLSGMQTGMGGVYGLFEAFLQSTVLNGFFMNQLGSDSFVYTVIILHTVATLIAAGYVAYKTVDSGVSFTNGFYYIYGAKSIVGQLLGLYEVIVIVAFECWSLVLSFFAIFNGMFWWDLLTLRLDEAAEKSRGLENALTWEKAIKASAMLLIITLGNVISGWCLGDTANELVSWFDQYDDDTSQEGREKQNPSNRDSDGTGAIYDVLYHFGTTFYAYFVFAAISIVGNIIGYIFIGFNDRFECDVESADIDAYQGFYDLAKTMTDRESCYKVIQDIFDIEDINNDSYVSRCEDAKFQFANGSSKEYALKFSSAYTRATFALIC